MDEALGDGGDWGAVRAELLAAAREASEAAQATVTSLGPARLSGREDGGHSCSLLVARTGAPVGEEHLQQAFLAVDHHDATRYAVHVEVRGADYLVSAPAAVAEAGSLQLFVRTHQQPLYDAMATAIEALEDGGLAPELAAGRLRAAPEEEAVLGPAHLNECQRRAYADMGTEGVNVVWGPPGTGKTEVISSFLAAALERGESVLLVSHTNVAVDNALARTVRGMGHVEPGTIIRVGRQVAPEIEEHPHLTIDKATTSVCGHGSRRAELAAERDALKQINHGRELHQLRRALAGWDRQRYEALSAQYDEWVALEADRRELGSLDRLAEDAAGLSEELRGSVLSDTFTETRRAVAERVAERAARVTLSDDEAAWVARSRGEGLAELDEQLARLEAESDGVKRRRDEIQAELDKLATELRTTRAALHSSAQLVACTLSGLSVNPNLAGRHFDWVIVDEAAAAWPVAVVYAAALARRGVSLIGDFCQNGPIPPVTGPGAHRFNRDGVFEVLGIHTGSDALERDGAGLVALSVQHRFGPLVTDLVNSTTYAGLLKAAPGWVGLGTRPEIAVLDVSGLGADLTRVRRPVRGSGRWWPAGALVSLYAADCFQKRYGERELGLVTPYRCQAGLVRAALDEAGLEYASATSHRMQGAEYDDVLFDLVESTGAPGWLCSDDPGALRVFTVAATRTRDRLRVVADLAHLGRQEHGPLAGLWDLLKNGRAEVLDAASMMGATLPQSSAISAATVAAEGEVGAALSPYLQDPATMFYNADQFYRELGSVVDGTQRDLQMWCPFVAKRRLGQVLGTLHGAVARGVAVTVYVKPQEELASSRMNTPALLGELRSAGVHVVEVPGAHEKALLVDSSTLYLGSLNILSNNGSTGEIVARFNGASVADKFQRFMGLVPGTPSQTSRP